ncbi:hypothetical protein ACJ6WF_20275 [Streptomyces sp. MMS24-I2-30]|uniref:hypothetical protein n=1 Tax=Streptomyces sp. MMS24-I2-30 TaxID=3351564 RepID=UPI003896EA17
MIANLSDRSRRALVLLTEGCPILRIRRLQVRILPSAHRREVLERSGASRISGAYSSELHALKSWFGTAAKYSNGRDRSRPLPPPDGRLTGAADLGGHPGVPVGRRAPVIAGAFRLQGVIGWVRSASVASVTAVATVAVSAAVAAVAIAAVAITAVAVSASVASIASIASIAAAVADVAVVGVEVAVAVILVVVV